MQLQANDIPLRKTDTVKQNRTNFGGNKSTFYFAQNLQPWKTPLLVPVLREINHFPVTLPDLLAINFDIILKSAPKTSNWYDSSIFSHQRSKHISKEIW